MLFPSSYPETFGPLLDQVEQNHRRAKHRSLRRSGLTPVTSLVSIIAQGTGAKESVPGTRGPPVVDSKVPKDLPDAIRRTLKMGPSSFCARVHQHEESHQRELLNLPQYYMYAKLMEHALEDLATALDGIDETDKTGWDNRYTLQLLFLSGIPKTLISALSLALQGYYDECLTLCRTSYESTLRVCFVQRFPEHMWAVVGTKQRGRRQFKPSKFLSEDLDVCVEDPFYRFLSYNVHGKAEVLYDVGEIKKGTFIGFGPRFQVDEPRVQVCLNNLVSVTYFASRILGVLFGDRISGTPFALPAPAAIEALLRDHRAKFSAIPKLVDDIIIAIG